MLFCSLDLPNMDWETWLQYLRLLDPDMYFHLHMCSTCEHMYVNICEAIHIYIYINVFCLHIYIYIYMIQLEYIHKSLQNVDNEKYLHDTTRYTLATWCEELTYWKRPWCWEVLKVGGEEDDRRWVGWMASLTWWTWVWASSGSWRWTGKPGVLQSMGVTKSWIRLCDWTEHINLSVLLAYLFWILSCVEKRNGSLLIWIFLCVHIAELGYPILTSGLC